MFLGNLSQVAGRPARFNNLPTDAYIRKMMEYAACTSIIPFKITYSDSLTENGIFKHCWEEYSRDIISESGAKIIILVGQDILPLFTESFKLDNSNLFGKEKSPSLDRNGNAYDIYLYEWGTRLVVNVAPNQGGMHNFNDYFPQNSFILGELKNRAQAIFNSVDGGQANNNIQDGQHN